MICHHTQSWTEEPSQNLAEDGRVHCLCFLCSLDDSLEVNLEEDSSEESSFLEAVKQMKGKKYENILDLCTQQIEKGKTVCLIFKLYMMLGQKKKTILQGTPISP